MIKRPKKWMKQDSIRDTKSEKFSGKMRHWFSVKRKWRERKTDGKEVYSCVIHANQVRHDAEGFVSVQNSFIPVGRGSSVLLQPKLLEPNPLLSASNEPICHFNKVLQPFLPSWHCCWNIEKLVVLISRFLIIHFSFFKHIFWSTKVLKGLAKLFGGQRVK